MDYKKLVVSRADLHGLLRSVLPAIGGSSSGMPILSHVLLSCRGGSLSAVCTNLELTLEDCCELIDLPDGFSVTVPAKLLYGICNSLGVESFLELVLDGDKLLLSSGSYSGVLDTLPVVDFPRLSLVGGDHSSVFGGDSFGGEGLSSGDGILLKIDCSLLFGMLSETHFAMASSDPRYFLNGMLFEFTPLRGVLRLVATDGHRLSSSFVEGLVCSSAGQSGADLSGSGSSGSDKFRCIVPRNSVGALRSWLSSSDGELELLLGKDHIGVRLGERRMVSKLIEARYPEYGRVIPARSEVPLFVDRGELSGALSRVALVAVNGGRDNRIPLVSLSAPSQTGLDSSQGDSSQTPTDDVPESQALSQAQRGLVVRSEGGGVSRAVDEVDVEYDGDELKAGFNASYLLDVLGCIRSERVEFHLPVGGGGVLISAVEESGTQESDTQESGTQESGTQESGTQESDTEVESPSPAAQSPNSPKGGAVGCHVVMPMRL